MLHGIEDLAFRVDVGDLLGAHNFCFGQNLECKVG